MGRQRGFTLVELMTAIALTAVLAGAIGGLLRHARADVASAGRHAEQLAGFRTAIASLKADLRAAHTVTTTVGELAIATSAAEVRWRCHGGVLSRTTERLVEPIAREVRAIRAERDGMLWCVTLHVGRASELRLAVLPRIEAAR